MIYQGDTDTVWTPELLKVDHYLSFGWPKYSHLKRYAYYDMISEKSTILWYIWSPLYKGWKQILEWSTASVMEDDYLKGKLISVPRHELSLNEFYT